MKILIPNYNLVDSFVDNVSFSLRQMGHEVINMGPLSVRKAYSKVGRVISDITSKVFKIKNAQEQFILDTIREHKFDVLISLTQSLSEEVLVACKKKGIINISWWGDTAANMQRMGLFSDYWDFVYIKDRYACKKLSGLGINALHLVEAMNPEWHRPVSGRVNNDIIIAGSFYDYRQYITQKLIQSNVDLGLYGPPLPLWASGSIKRIHKGKYITRLDKAKVFGQGLAVLNSTAMSEFDSMNCRAFEIAGCGGLQIMENRTAIEECFEPGKEILVYDSFEELLELISWAKNYPLEAQKIREAGLKRALSDHTYQNRLEFIFSNI